MSTIKDKNGLREMERLNRRLKDLTETEEIKKRWQKYREELYKKDLNNSDNHDDVFIYPESDMNE